MKKEYSKPETLSFIINTDIVTTSPPTLTEKDSNEQEWNLSKRRDALTEMLEESEDY